MQPGLLQVGAGDDGGDTGDLERLAGVDALDRRVGVRAPDDVQPEHARQDEVVDVLALAADEPWVFLALDGVAHAPDFGRGVGGDLGHVVYLAAAGSAGASCAALSSPAACWIALTMFT